MRKIYRVGCLEGVVRESQDLLVPRRHAHGTRQRQETARSTEGARAGLPDPIDERQGAAVQDRHFGVVHLDPGVVDRQPLQGRQQVLHRRDDHLAARQGGRKVAAVQQTIGGRDLRFVEVAPYEDDAAARLSRQDPQRDPAAGMQPHALDLDRSGERLLTLGHDASPCVRSRTADP